MKKQNLLTTMLLLFALIVGSGSAWADTVTDELDRALTGVNNGSTTYSDWSGKTSNSVAVYAGNSAGGNDAIQLRSNNSNSGVVTTTSGGKVKKITVAWQNSTQSGRTINIYGNNTAYSAPTDLYNTNMQGTLLGTISTGTTTLTVTGDYKYIGIRSASGALYLTSISIEWETSGGSSSAVATSVTIDDASLTNTDVYTSTAAGSLSATVMDNNNSEISGATVTWESSDDDVATIDADGTVTLVAAGTTTITASYAGVEDEYQSSSATYELTVTSTAPYVQPTSVNVSLSNTLFGLSTTGGNGTEQSTTVDNVTITTGCTSSASSKTYYDTGHVRFYDKSYLKLKAPDGYNITKVEFTAEGTWNGSITASDGTYTNANKTWTGEASELQFNFAAQNRIATVAITLEVPTVKYAFNFSANLVAGGTIEVEDENGYEVTSGDTFAEGAALTIQATANEGYTFSGWTEANDKGAFDDANSEIATFTMPAEEVTVTANFTVNTYELSTTSDHGTLAVTVNGEDWNGIDKIPYGAEVSITATANTDWAFSSWATSLGTYDDEANPLVFNMPADDVLVEANYVDASTVYTVTYYVAGEEFNVTRNSNAQLNLTSPDAINGMEFAGWSESNDLSSAPTFVANTTAVTSDMTLYAVFAAQMGTNYVKQTTGTIESGEYLIVYEGGTSGGNSVPSVAFMGSLDTFDVVNNGIEVTIENNTIASSLEIDENTFTIDATTGYVMGKSGKYIGQTSYGNGLVTSEGGIANSFSFDGGNVVIACTIGENTVTMRYNYASDQRRFRYYKSGQQAIALYKKSVSISGYSLGLPETVSVTAAKYATFSAAQPVDFTGTGITVYTAKANGTSVDLEEVTDGIVPANTGVVLYSASVITNQEVPATVCSKSSLDNNEMVANVTASIVAKTANGKTNYILSNEDAGVGFYLAVEGGATLPAKRAYLSTTTVPAPARFMGIFNDDDATGIAEMQTVKNVENGKFYNLNGQQVAQPTKGLYIVNGKKVIK